MKTFARTFFALSALALAAPAQARVGELDVVPAATLLVPYFEVDLADKNGANTILHFQEMRPEALLTRVTLWTDYGVPTYGFNVYLTGFDAHTIDLRLLFQSGSIATNASSGQDPMDTLTPKGPSSQDINFASCSGMLPSKRLGAAQLDHLRKAHTGQASSTWGGKCGGAPIGDNIARGYITIDTVNACGELFPTDPSYPPYLSPQNNLTGDFLILNRGAKIAYGAHMAHIEASNEHPEVITSGQATFYGAYYGYTAADRREPLATQWRARYVTGGAATTPLGPYADGKTSLLVWRDPATLVAPFTCGATPSGFPLGQGALTAFDEAENVTTLTPSSPFPRVAQRVSAADASIGIPYTAGILALDLGHSTGMDAPEQSPGQRQSYVTVMHQATADTHAVALPAFPVASASWGRIRVFVKDARRCLDATACSTGDLSKNDERLITSNGQTATFLVSLSQPPTAPVTLAFTTTDATKATVTASVSWMTGDATPKTVTVTGATTKGTYTVTTGAAVSTDPFFSGFNPADVLGGNR